MPAPQSIALQPPVSARDHVLGPPEAAVTVVEYGDFQCPHCAKAAVMVCELRGEMPGTFNFVFRHFPLGKIHVQARKAAEASEAAAAQGKFWEMHDDLFAHSKELELDQIVKRAADLGIDVIRMRKEIDAGTYLPRLQDDQAGGIRSGVNGTPTFFVAGQRIAGVVTAEVLRGAILTAG